MANVRILDPCCGSRMMWRDRSHPDVVFGDRRRETVTVTDRSHGRAGGTRTLRIEPDTILDFRDLPFPAATFDLIAFDPPHLVRAGPHSWLAAKYGKLSDDWRKDLSRGFAECLRVLKPSGTLIFKWNETQVKVSEVLNLCPIPPLFGHLSGRKGLTHWLVFISSPPEIAPAPPDQSPLAVEIGQILSDHGIDAGPQVVERIALAAACCALRVQGAWMDDAT